MVNHIRVWFLFVCLLLGLCIGCSGQPLEKPKQENLSVTPAEETQALEGTFAAGTFRYTLPEDKENLTLSVEQWEKGIRMDCQTLPVSLETGREGTLTLGLKLNKEPKQTALWIGQSNGREAGMELPLLWENGLVYAFWSQEDAVWYQNWKDADLAAGIILACLGTGDLERGLPNLACSTLLEDPSYFTQFEEIQLVRVTI